MKTKLVYISGGDSFSPSEIKAALDDIRKDLGLPGDVVLFGLPVEAEHAEEPAVPDHKILQFPSVRRRSILNVIESPAAAAPMEEITISDSALIVDSGDDDDDDGGDDDEPVAAKAESITALFAGLPSMSEETPPPAPMEKSLAAEFGEYLDKEDAVEPAPKKAKVKPFGRKGKNPFNNVLGDLFSFAGIAANDDAEDYALPDFIKRP